MYVESENKYGIGEFSNRIVFRTAKTKMGQEEDKDKANKDAFTPTECCSNSGVKDTCKINLIK